MTLTTILILEHVLTSTPRAVVVVISLSFNGEFSTLLMFLNLFLFLSHFLFVLIFLCFDSLPPNSFFSFFFNEMRCLSVIFLVPCFSLNCFRIYTLYFDYFMIILKVLHYIINRVRNCYLYALEKKRRILDL